MDWIKTKYDRAILLVATALLLASAAFVFLKTRSVGDTFAAYFSKPSISNAIKPLNIDPINEARETLANPAKWKKQDKTIFVAVPYVLRKSGVLEIFGNEGIEYVPGIPNKWFVDNGLDLLVPGIEDQDPDGDRFSNREEYAGGVNSTNPNDPNSHPPFTNKLKLARYIQIPFRLIFKVRDGEIMQINTVDLKQPSQFLKVGDRIGGTKFEITKLEKKEGVDSLGTKTDVSEATVRNVETKAEIILVLGVIANSPDTYALFKYLYDDSEFKVKRDGEFHLKPDDKTTYKLVDINNNEAVITIPATGEKITVPKL
ncbi:MAG: Amuc_1099 family pilus-like system protein [Chthoniobacterales bacterium]